MGLPWLVYVKGLRLLLFVFLFSYVCPSCGLLVLSGLIVFTFGVGMKPRLENWVVDVVGPFETRQKRPPWFGKLCDKPGSGGAVASCKTTMKHQETSTFGLDVSLLVVLFAFGLGLNPELLVPDVFPSTTRLPGSLHKRTP